METNPIVIECVSPQLDGGRHAIKREVGERLTVSADVYQHGHDILSVALFFRHGQDAWRETPMTHTGNDRWTGSFELDAMGMYEFTLVAWVEHFASWRRDTERKRAAQQDITSDVIEGQELVRRVLKRAKGGDGAILRQAMKLAEPEAALLTDEIEVVMRRYPDRPARPGPRAQRWRILCERERARYGAWYEMFPRSQGTDPARSATFLECAARLPEIRDLGFDVVYLPPIHPIGQTKRKGRNNSLVAAPDDPGSPYAIGSEAGGHDAVEPGLGTLADFDHFVAACHAHGMEVALDFAINCSPDHPYVREHPEWFYHRPDGTIKYAENPPKRYEDIYPLNLDGPYLEDIARELARVLLFWCEHGVRIFRVDNPHTKPMPLWEYLLPEVRAVYPDTVFLSEAFTRPKPMKHLAKVGFSQSYTYFTWRNQKQELGDYIQELALGPCREYFRPNFFANTPDILPEVLQRGGRPAFLMRLVLAATLSPSYGLYSGYELCENRAVPGTEEYLDSEKYEFKVWDWNREGNIKAWVKRINQIRRAHPALHRIEGLRLLPAQNDHLLFYARFTPSLDDVLAICVNMDPFHEQEGPVEIPIEELGLGNHAGFRCEDLLSGPRGVWRGRHHHLKLDPRELPAAILHLTPA